MSRRLGLWVVDANDDHRRIGELREIDATASARASLSDPSTGTRMVLVIAPECSPSVPNRPPRPSLVVRHPHSNAGRNSDTSPSRSVTKNGSAVAESKLMSYGILYTTQTTHRRFFGPVLQARGCGTLLARVRFIIGAQHCPTDTVYPVRREQMGASTAVQIPTWQLDPTHSSVEFSVKHMMMTTVRGRFKDVQATLRGDRDHPEELASRPRSGPRASTPASPTAMDTCAAPTSSTPSASRTSPSAARVSRTRQKRGGRVPACSVNS